MSTTRELINDLIKSKNISQTIKDHEEDFIEIGLAEFLAQMLQKYGMKRLDVIERANMSVSYGYQVMDGIKKPKREKLIQLCFGFPMELEELQTALRCGGVNDLNPRNKRDAYIMHASANGMDLEQLNRCLYTAGEKEIGSN